jgi:hypothetical protein
MPMNLPATIAAARDFFLDRQPSVASAIAAAEVTVAVLAAGLLLWAATRLARAAGGRLPRPRARTFVGAAALAAGLLVLAAGLQHHLAATTVVLDGGSLQEAGRQLAR